MSILTADEIRKSIESGGITIDPCDEKRIQPNSVDVTLGRGVVVYENFTHVGPYQKADSLNISLALSNDFPSLICPGVAWLDAKQENPVRSFTMDESGWVVMPGILYLMHVNERTYAPGFVMTITGKSSIARLGLIVHFTAAHAETGFNGQFTLEVSAINHPVRIYPDMAIGQILFETICGEPSDYAKQGNYTGVDSIGAVPSRSWKQFV